MINVFTHHCEDAIIPEAVIISGNFLIFISPKMFCERNTTPTGGDRRVLYELCASENAPLFLFSHSGLAIFSSENAPKARQEFEKKIMGRSRKKKNAVS